MMLNRVFAVQVLEEVVDVVGMSNLFFEAAETELRLPAVRRQSVKSCWPDYAPDVDLAFGYNETITRLAKASPKQITRYDLALQCVVLLEVEDRKLLWAVAHSAARRQRGARWRVLGKMMDMHHATVKRKFERVILELWYKTLTLTNVTK
tara:strand:+ start:789 stop:1238 length:450 start_codon:yes stop_codon:yes gene_type:complete